MGLRAIPPAWYCGLSTTQRPRERGAPFRTPLAHGQRRRGLCHLAWRGRRGAGLVFPRPPGGPPLLPPRPSPRGAAPLTRRLPTRGGRRPRGEDCPPAPATPSPERHHAP